jgi:hypothetical protein
MALEAMHKLMSHNTVSTEKVGAVEAPCNSTGLARLAPSAIGCLDLVVCNSTHPIVCQEAGNTGGSQLAVGLARRACDLLGVVLAAFQAMLAECVEAGEHFGGDKGPIAHRALGVGTGEAAATEGGGGQT